MSRLNLILMIVLALGVSMPASAATVAYWDFENSTLTDTVPTNAQPFDDGSAENGDYGTLDTNGILMRGWGPTYGPSFSNVSPTGFGFSMRNVDQDGYVYSTGAEDPAQALIDFAPAAWTIEATFKMDADEISSGENGTIIGRDGAGTHNSGSASSIYFQKTSDNYFRCDVATFGGQRFEVNSIDLDLTIEANKWYSMAVTSDGTTLSLYVNDIAADTGWQLVDTTDMSAAVNSAMDTNTANWVFGRGWFDEHVDKIHGYIDEVRFSDTALTMVELITLETPPQPDNLDSTTYGALFTVENSGFDANGAFATWPSVPGWTGVDDGTIDSGVQARGDAPDGDGFCAFVRNATDPDGIWQVTDVNIVADLNYELEVMVQDHYGGGDQAEIALFYLDPIDPNIKEILSSEIATDLTTTLYVPLVTSFSVSAGDPAIGEKLGILLRNPEDAGTDDSISGFDAIKLYDAATRVDIYGVRDHEPAGLNSYNPETPMELTWTPSNEPNIISQKLYYYIGDGNGSSGNITAYNAVQPKDDLSASASSYSITEGMTYDQYCLWRIDTVCDYDTFTGQTVVFNTRTADEVPVITPGDNWITWQDEMVTLTATVDDFNEFDVSDIDNVWSIVGGAIPWDDTYQMTNNPEFTDNLAALEANGYDPDLFVDAIGTDTRGNLYREDPLTLTISGLTPGTAYTYTSYHHHVNDQHGPFEVTVIDNAGTNLYTGYVMTSGAADPNKVFTKVITTDGSGSFQVQYDITGTENSTSIFLMNGFVLSDSVNPDLKVDFGQTASAVADGYQAYTAEHEIPSSFTTQYFDALGTTNIALTPTWSSYYYLTLTDASSDWAAPAATLVTNWLGDLTVQLDTTDRGRSLGDQPAIPVHMTVRVAADECAAKQLETAGYNDADFDTDCDVDINDLAVFAIQWLDDIKLTAPAAY